MNNERWVEIYDVAKRLGIRRAQDIVNGIGVAYWNYAVDLWREELKLSGEEEREFFNETISGWQNKMREGRE